MDNIITEQQIKEIIEEIVEGYQPQKIILFGSYASGTPTEDSDIDLLIIKDTNDSPRERRKKFHISYGDPAFPKMYSFILKKNLPSIRILPAPLCMRQINLAG